MSEAELREEINSPPAVLSEERKRELLAFWRDALAGKIQPEVLHITPEIEAAIRAKERSFLVASRLLEKAACSLTAP